MRITLLCAAVFVAVPQAEAGEPKDGLAPPVHVVAEGKPLDTGGLGYASPFFGDFDGDSVRDLLVGEMEHGQMRVYRNLGTNRQPKFDRSFWFTIELGEEPGGAESGRVPAG